MLKIVLRGGDFLEKLGEATPETVSIPTPAVETPTPTAQPETPKEGK